MTMLDRVAEAIGKTVPGRTDETHNTPWSRLAATAAILAMREPTDEIRAAGCIESAVVSSAEFASPYECGEIWKAMIDAALNEEGE